MTEALLSKAAGWEAMKRARDLWERGQVLRSSWSPPRLDGVVQDGSVSYRAGLIIKGALDLENLCHCRDARDRGLICAHSVAVGLHCLKPAVPQFPQTLSPDSPRRADRATKNKPVAPPKKTGPRLRPAAPGDAGEPLELSVILPPNFAQTASRGRVVVCVEGQWRGGRSPLDALPATAVFQLSPEDSALLDRWETLADGESPAMLMVTGADLAGLLETLVGHPRVSLGRNRPIKITAEPATMPIEASLERGGEIVLQSSIRSPAIIAGDTLWIFQGATIQPVALATDYLGVLRGPLKLPRDRVPQFLIVDWPALQAVGAVKANFRPEDFTVETAAPGFRLTLTGGLTQLHARLEGVYGSHMVVPGANAGGESPWLPDPANVTHYWMRHADDERAAVSRLLRAGFTGLDAHGRYQLAGESAVLNFFARDFPHLQAEWNVTLEERLERTSARTLERIEPQVWITSSGVQWFDFNVAFASASGEQLPAAEIQRLLRSGQSYTRLKDGRLALIDTGAVEELQEVLVDCAPQQHAAGYRMNNTQAGFLETTLRQRLGWQAQAPPAWRERARQQSGDAKLDCPALGELEAVLRPYQKHGVAWLHFLRQNGFGGILADEMGLGKTLQTLTLLQTVKLASAPNADAKTERAPDDVGCPSLIICPTSLVFNWVSEARKFTPQLRVLALHGPERHALFDQVRHSDLLITSYALVRRDAERYRDLEFDTVVLDEAQHIKNRQTQNAQAVKAVRSRHRLVLTGTPLENSVLDLWSIFDFLMPAYLGSAADFRERYELPITRDKSAEVQARLGRRLRPFILRRLKREVAPDLPPKLEQVLFCELTETQRAVYRQVMEAGRREILDAVGARGLAKSRMLIFNTLLRLRQICCDLRLLKLDRVDPTTASAKLELFGELLEEALDGGHRVLVFSQFVSMLSLLRERLEAEDVEFCYLDGATVRRAEVVQRFQSRADIPVFLISLKAGGVGLNLTGADTVIHFDPWWNPAVEQQATDRAHRIGQTRAVTSYKLIARGTVEEKILALQNRKREIVQATLGGEEQLAEALTWDEIQELFAG
ncbi:MAG: DEAD/DEAH box helicase [Limisphaerales bacterium]